VLFADAHDSCFYSYSLLKLKLKLKLVACARTLNEYSCSLRMFVLFADDHALCRRSLQILDADAGCIAGCRVGDAILMLDGHVTQRCSRSGEFLIFQYTPDYKIWSSPQ
jgi:hypothetical protein